MIFRDWIRVITGEAGHPHSTYRDSKCSTFLQLTLQECNTEQRVSESGGGGLWFISASYKKQIA